MSDLQTEYALFEEALPDLISNHRGEFALFHAGNAVGFFNSYRDAYVAGLDTFGLDDMFLIAEVKEPEPHPVSVSWQSGVMFDPHE